MWETRRRLGVTARPANQRAASARPRPLRPWGWFPPGEGRGGGTRRTEGRRHLGGGDVSRALCSGPGSCRRVGRGGGRVESGDLAAGRVPGGGTATCGARRPSASGKPAAGGSFCDPRPRSRGSLVSGGQQLRGDRKGSSGSSVPSPGLPTAQNSSQGSVLGLPQRLQSGKCAPSSHPDSPTPYTPTVSSQGSISPSHTRPLTIP